MPNYFAFKSKATGERVDLDVVDESICRSLGIEVHPTKYAFGWYDAIGELIALGKDAEQMRELFKEFETRPEQLATALAIIDHLDAEFTWNAWYQPKM